MSDERDGAELPALRDLVQSEGWQVFTAAYEASWGPAATLQQIEQAVAVCALGDQAAVQDATQHLLTAQRKIRALMAWPEERIKLLTAHGQKKGWLDQHRRSAR